MNREKRGGARLAKNASTKNEHAGPDRASTSSHRRGKAPGAKGGLSRQGRIALIVLAAVAAVFLIVFAVYKHWAKLPDLPTPPALDVTADPITGQFPSQGPGSSSRKKEFYTFLVVGRDTGGGGNTDTMMLAAYDVPNQKLAVMSLPRDTLVDAHHPGKNRKLNAVWNLGLHYAEKGSEKKGIDYLKETLGEMIGFAPDFYVIVNWEAFGRLVDAIGGVDFEVPFEMKYNDPTQNLVIDQAAGYRHLSGDDAMQVVRWRHNNSYSVQYADADLGRIRTQQALMKEIVKKCLKIENVAKINKFAQIFTEEVETDLTLGNLVAFAERAIFGGLSVDNVVFTTMPYAAVYVGKQSYVQAKPDELLGILNESFNPYAEDLEMESLHILQYKPSVGYYTYTGSGTGTPPTYTDPKPAHAVVKDTPKPTDTDAKPSEQTSAAPESDTPSNRPSDTPEETQPSQDPDQESPEPSQDPDASIDPDQESPEPSSGAEDSTPTPAPSDLPAPPQTPDNLGIPMD